MITIDAPNLREILKRLPVEKDARKAAFRAINRSLVAGRTAAGQEVAKDYKISGGKVSKIAKFSKANSSRIEAKITWKGPAIPLEEWGTNPSSPPKRRRKKPLVGKVFRSKNTTYKGVFVGKYNSGKSRAYIRSTKKRFPIKRVYGPSAAQLVAAKYVKERFMNRTNEMLEKRLEHEINYILNSR